jgi:excisionase family DNA binding protein
MVELKERRHRQPDQGGIAVPIADRLTLSVDDAAQLSGLPRSFVLKSIHDDKLKAIRIGRSYHVKRSDLDRFVQEL